MAKKPNDRRRKRLGRIRANREKKKAAQNVDEPAERVAESENYKARVIEVKNELGVEIDIWELTGKWTGQSDTVLASSDGTSIVCPDDFDADTEEEIVAMFSNAYGNGESGQNAFTPEELVEAFALLPPPHNVAISVDKAIGYIDQAAEEGNLPDVCEFVFAQQFAAGKNRKIVEYYVRMLVDVLTREPAETKRRLEILTLFAGDVCERGTLGDVGDNYPVLREIVARVGAHYGIPGKMTIRALDEFLDALG